jgi:hypothetical protein
MADYNVWCMEENRWLWGHGTRGENGMAKMDLPSARQAADRFSKQRCFQPVVRELLANDEPGPIADICPQCGNIHSEVKT